jgi:agmatinase
MTRTIRGPDFIPFNFGALGEVRSSLRDSRVAILPVPYDSTSTYLAGSRDGPQAIISASRNMELFDEELGLEPSHVGIHTLPFLDPITGSPDEMVRVVSSVVDSHVETGKFVVLLGGDHILAVGAVAAVKKSDPLGVIQFDAHADLRESYQGTKMSHACTGRRLAEMCPLLQVGTRSMSQAEHEFRASCDVRSLSPSHLEEFSERLGDLPEEVYVSIDVDVLDPSIMPSVGTPEPGGLSWAQIVRLTDEIAVRKKVVGFDVTELRPIPGLVAPDFLAAKLVYRLIGRFVTPAR